MPIKKKPGAPARKAAKPRRGRAKPKAAVSKTQVPPSDRSQATIRRLRAELAKARALVEQLQASADMDFLLGILNRRGFERELNRSISYIRRYHARGVLIVLDVDRLTPINAK